MPPLTIKHINHHKPSSNHGFNPSLTTIQPSTNSQPAGRLDAAALCRCAARTRAVLVPEAGTGEGWYHWGQQAVSSAVWMGSSGWFTSVITSCFISEEPSGATAIHRASRARTTVQVKNPVSNTTCTLSTQQQGGVVNLEHILRRVSEEILTNKCYMTAGYLDKSMPCFCFFVTEMMPPVR